MRIRWAMRVAMIRIRSPLVIAPLVAALLIIAPQAWGRQGSAVPKSVEPSPAVVAAIAAEWMTGAQQREARVNHGLWTEADLTDPALRARAAIDAGVPNAAFAGGVAPAGIDASLVAEALLRQGKCADAIAALTDLPGIPASSLRAEAFEALGRVAEAAHAADEVARDLAAGKAKSADDLVRAAIALQVLARVRTTDTSACEAIMEVLAEAIELDRLNWRSRVAEGRFLTEKHNLEEAVTALREALRLNPRAAEAWTLLGKVALMGFDFDGTQRAAENIRAGARSVDPSAVCAPAALLEAESACARFDSAEALAIIEPVRVQMPALMQSIALEAAAHALEYDFDAMRVSLAKADAIAPGSARALWQVARFLALARQYAEARDLLHEAQRREPNWSIPRNELGLLEMQAGQDEAALVALTEAARLDPYDKRVEFTKHLVEELLSWKTFDSEHFRVRCKPGIDEILASAMPAQLESMYTEVCGRFGHEPKGRTTIELMPDHKYFAVRITGMPQIHTVAASTGPVIALEPPKEGGRGRSLGRFDWLDTLRHEFVHTVTLDRTMNRIPHWFTEAAAVDMEHKARDWMTYQLLTKALDTGELFDLDSIKWAFVRPTKATDRAQAYAQGHWMVEFMREAYGAESVVRLLDRYARGEAEAKAFPAVLGLTREQFMTDFTAWATEQVASWRLSEKPPVDELIVDARSKAELGDDAPVTDEFVEAMVALHPHHADILEIAARRAVARLGGAGDPKAHAGGLDDPAAALLERYSKERPLDPWPHELLAARSLAMGDRAAAMEHLIFLDRRADSDPSFALELARSRRAAKDHAGASKSAERAVRIDPYDAPTRELAASCAIEASDLALARGHIAALTHIEPSREQHAKRLAKINEMIEKASATLTPR